MLVLHLGFARHGMLPDDEHRTIEGRGFGLEMPGWQTGMSPERASATCVTCRAGLKSYPAPFDDSVISRGTRMSAQAWTFWTDYDGNALNTVPQPQQQQVWADWLEERVNRTVLAPLRKIKDEDIQPAGVSSSALLVFSVSICCAIEAMGKYLCGATKSSGILNNERFKCFVRKYMNSDYNTETLDAKLYSDYLWDDFRNALAHGFAIARGKFEQSGNQDYFVKSTDSMGHYVLSLNWDKLFSDFERACKHYFNDVRKANGVAKIVTDFKAVFREVCIDRD